MGNEESWQGEVRVEVKAGKQVQTPWTKYQIKNNLTLIQGLRYKTFMFVAMPDGTLMGLLEELDKL